MNGKVEARLRRLGSRSRRRPTRRKLRPLLITGNLLFISGQISKAADGSVDKGRLGAELTVDQGRAAARLCALNMLAQAKAAVGELDRIAQVVRLTGFVNAAPEFTDHPQVINGASDLMVEVFGDKGRHTRAAVGVSSLPMGCAVEVDAILLIET